MRQSVCIGMREYRFFLIFGYLDTMDTKLLHYPDNRQFIHCYPDTFGYLKNEQNSPKSKSNPRNVLPTNLFIDSALLQFQLLNLKDPQLVQQVHNVFKLTIHTYTQVQKREPVLSTVLGIFTGPRPTVLKKKSNT